MAIRLSYQTQELPFQHPFVISGGRQKTHQPALIICLQIGSLKGWGEAPAISYYHITIEQMIKDLEKYTPSIEKFSLTDPERFWHFLHHLIPHNPFLVCALDIAAWDIFGKMHQKPLYELWNTSWNSAIQTDYTIGIDTPEKMIEKIKQKPWPIYKIKVGTHQDIETITLLRKHTNAPFRLDANGGWTLEEVLRKIPILQDLQIEMIEQPLPKEQWEEMSILFNQSPIPLFADESCVFEQDVIKCKNHFHGINIKLTKCGGLTPALRMIKKARENNLHIMVGTMNESTIGSLAIAHLIPQIDFVDMDGPLLLCNDPIKSIHYENGHISIPHTPGLGITL